ncbi:MAG: glutamate--tRNA ligase [Gloeobacterales cyanobacterium]
MTVRVRIAPSPTGNLHIGTARTAVFNYLFARHHQGQFILRIEDTDLERSRPEFTENILEGLKWLGLNWDEGPFFQSERMDLYRQKIQALLDKGLAYRAYDTPEELDAMREAQKVNSEAPRYDNRHRDLTAEQEATFKAEGRKPVIRFKIEDDREITWNDLVRGKMSWKGRDLGGDMVIARASEGSDIGQPLYNFVVVVDDIDMKISHVIRGEDHISNTPKQILLYEAFGASVPEFGHTPLILNQAGAKLSKRDGVTSIADFRAMGYSAEALANYMTLLGWSPPEGAMEEIFSLDQAAQHFSFDRVNKAGAKFDWDKLNWLNGQHLRRLAPSELSKRLLPVWQAAGYEVPDDAVWLEGLCALLGQSLNKTTEAPAMAQTFFVEPTFEQEALEHLKQTGVGIIIQTFEKLFREWEKEDLPVQEGLWKMLEEKIQAAIQEQISAFGVKKGLVMKTLRMALTGTKSGPELVPTIALLLARKEVAKRLTQAGKVVSSMSGSADV